MLGTAAQAIDQLAAGQGLRTELLHAFDGLGELGLAVGAGLAHMLRSGQGVLGARGTVLLGMGDGLGGLADLLHGRQLRLQTLGQVLDRVGDLGRRQRVVAGMPRQSAAEFDEVATRFLLGRLHRLVTALPGPQPGP